MSPARFAVAPLLAAAALGVAGCGGSDDNGGNGNTTSSDQTSTEEWAGGVCSAITTWQDSTTSVTTSLQESGITADSVESSADDVKSATQTLIDDLQGLGTPDTDSGQEAKDDLDALSTELQNGVDEIESDVSDVSGLSDVANAISSVTSTLATMATQVSTTFSDLQSLDAEGELSDAFQQASSCDSLTSSS